MTRAWKWSYVLSAWGRACPRRARNPVRVPTSRRCPCSTPHVWTSARPTQSVPQRTSVAATRAESRVNRRMDSKPSQVRYDYHWAGRCKLAQSRASRRCINLFVYIPNLAVISSEILFTYFTFDIILPLFRSRFSKGQSKYSKCLLLHRMRMLPLTWGVWRKPHIK